MSKPVRDFSVINYAGFDVLQPRSDRGKEKLVIKFVEPEYQTQPIIIPSLAIMHSHSSGRKITWQDAVRFWSRPENVGEAHASVQMDGVFAQTMPFNRRADTNYKANSWRDSDGKLRGAISFETQDEGGATVDMVPWTAEQIESMAQALAALILYYPESMACWAPAHYRDRGIGYHSQFPEWSSFRGKTCPGFRRIKQMDWLRWRVADLVCNGEWIG